MTISEQTVKLPLRQQLLGSGESGRSSASTLPSQPMYSAPPTVTPTGSPPEKLPEMQPAIESATVTTGFSWRSQLAFWVSPQIWVRKIVHQQDSPHSIALGTAIGTFISFTPTVGIQMFIVLAVGWLTSRMFRFNRISALVAVYISNPVTTLPIYWFNYWVGTFFVSGELTRDRLAELLNYESFSAWWLSLFELTYNIGWPLMIGSVLVGLVCAMAIYPVTKWLVSTLQQQRRALRLLQAHKKGE